jgi:uncharacterized protein DUF1186/SEC-C motif-containing protein
MKKEEPEAILGNGSDELDLGPIEENLHAVATERKLPVLALGQCTIRIEESSPALLALLERAADGETLAEDEEMLLFRGLYILGGARVSQAYLPLLRLLRRPGNELEYLLGDAITESLASIVAGVFDGDAEPLFELALDASIDGYIREALLGAATFLTWKGLIERERMRRVLVQFYKERLAADDDQAWVGWLEAIALLGLRDLAPLVRAAWDEGRVPSDLLERSEFEEELAEAEQRPDDIDRFSLFHFGYIEDVVEALKWSDYREDEDALLGEGDPFGEDIFASDHWKPMEPVRNPLRHVGRNDPCPCGSGKKAKKCCLARQD